MNPTWLIIDGYNVLHQVDEFVRLARTDLHLARQRLIRLIEHTSHQMAPQTTIVFDGRESGQDESLTTKHIEIYFSPGNLSADSIIERLVCKYTSPEKILVVTSDRAEHETVASAGAHVMSSEEFVSRCLRDARKKVPKQTPPGKEPKLGDLFP